MTPSPAATPSSVPRPPPVPAPPHVVRAPREANRPWMPWLLLAGAVAVGLAVAARLLRRSHRLHMVTVTSGQPELRGLRSDADRAVTRTVRVHANVGDSAPPRLVWSDASSVNVTVRGT
ncbi:hypothetical protein AKJ09_11245 [Labilithrix luteola]|uniref:Uncharacterized protein n=1 Tax=Labilithrix luteola TaxID=1391654 RepID=A0A0K1QFZ5_9BACT|nr:hypothetical protein AKJ09_11245 [Labilithrix luteola]